jgi:ceramide glucosyltransferase
MTAIAILLLTLAVIGLLSSGVYLVLTLLGVAKFRRQGAAQRKGAETKMPAVSVLKPLHGIEPQMERNLESFFLQKYGGQFEVLFAVDHANDTALPVARKVCEKYPAVRSQILITGEPDWPNPPAQSFSRMAEVARNEILVTSDSDVEVDENYLSAIVPVLCDRRNGMLTCVYRGVNSGGIWSALDAAGMSVEMTAGVLVANLLEGMKFGLGPTIAVRREALDAIGGFEALGEYFSNDFVIGNMIASEGFQVILSHYVVSHIVPPMTFRKMWRRQVRWAAGTKHSRPKGHFGTVFVFAMPYGLFGLLGAALLGHVALGFGLLCLATLNRVVEAYVVGWRVVGDRECLTKPWLYPMRDLLGFAVWAASYLSRRMRWRDGRFELVKGGRILVRDRVAIEQE